VRPVLFKRRSVQTISPATASDRFFCGHLSIVDVRSDAEWAEARVPGSTHIPLGKLRHGLPHVRDDRPVAFLCRSGHRSRFAARHAARHRSDTTSIEGGLNAWIAATLPIARCAAPTESPNRCTE
jgi:rhodanese-related sulfurtransferase